MKTLVLLLLVSLNTCFSLAVTPPAGDSKTRIREELKSLKDSLKATDKDLVALQVMYRDVQNAMKNLEDWALDQQRLKDDYYKRLEEMAQQANSAETRVNEVKEKNEQVTRKYTKAKLVLCYAAAALLALGYLSTLSPLMKPVLQTLAGAWYPVLMFVTPALAFALGYFIAYLYF